MDGEISNIPGTTRSKTVLQLAQKRYKRTIMRNDRQYPEQAWDAAATCACEKVEINKEGEEKGRLFHKFLCVMGECKNCPKWEDITNLLERESEVPIRYNVWARHGSCSVHKERAIGPCSNDAVGCLLCDPMDQAERDKQKANFKWKYLRVQKTELMKDFMKEGGTYHTHMKAMLYPTFLIVMLGSRVFGRMVQEEVARKKNGLLFRRNFSENSHLY